MLKRMKTAITLLIIFICTSTYGQFDKLKGIWITSDQDLISIKEDDGIIWGKLSNKLFEDKWTELYPSTCLDSLKFYYKYIFKGSSFSEPYFFKILNITDTFLIVKPITDFSMKFFQNRDTIKFVRQEYAIDTSFKFEKIIYHTTNDCFSDIHCPVINLQIDNKKHIYFEGEFKKENYKIDNKHTGQFTGTLSNQLYNELIHLLQTCNVRTLTFDNNWYSDDSPERTFIIYFNGQRKYLKSTVPPFIVDSLIEFLDTINLRLHLIRTNEKLNLEK